MNDFDIPVIEDPNLESAIIIVSGELDSMRVGTFDPGAIFKLELIDAITLIYECDKAQYQRLRFELKKHIPIAALEKMIFENAGSRNLKMSPADELVNLVNVDLELFHDEEKQSFATVNIRGHNETYKIISSSFYDWLATRFYKQTKRCPTELTIRTAQQALSAKARFEGMEIKPFLRIANYRNGYVFDLGDPEWKAIIVSPDKWEVVNKPPVKFWRNENMKPLPVPNEKGSLRSLWQLLNVSNNDRVFILAFIFECWRNNTMFPILELIGEQGTAKSYIQSVLREFIDPNKVSLRAAPKTVEDLFVSASQNWLASYNNLSYLKSEMQDAFCTLSTGGGHSSRKLYTNNEESVIDVSRPCIINGIGGIATAQDLLDRVIRIELKPIKAMTPVSKLNELLESEKANILGGLLNRFVKTLSYLPSVNSKSINDRMADFILLGEAMLLSMDKKYSFANLYQKKKSRAALQAIESSPSTLAIIRIVSEIPYHGTYASLFRRLKANYSSFDLPRSPKGVADLLRRQAPALRKIGIKVTHHKKRKNDGYHVSVEKINY